MNQKTIVERVIETILIGIENGTFQEGTALPPQRQLAEYFGASRVVIREAIKVLEGRGILASKRGSGIYVLHADPVHLAAKTNQIVSYSLEEILVFCQMIWHSAMRELVKADVEDDLLHLKKRTEQLLENFTTASVHQKFIYESSFGMTICQLCKNHLAYDLMSKLLKVTADIDYQIISADNYKDVLKIDLKIIESLMKKDTGRAFFLGNERDLEIGKMLKNCTELLQRRYAVPLMHNCPE